MHESLNQVDSAHNADGYRHYVSIPEWYALRTPFTQWYTKNFSSVFLPTADAMQFGCQHVGVQGFS